jgi:hypothetical protein
MFFHNTDISRAFSCSYRQSLLTHGQKSVWANACSSYDFATSHNLSFWDGERILEISASWWFAFAVATDGWD